MDMPAGKDIVQYLIRSSKMEFEINNQSDTVVMFIHGIFTNSQRTFKLNGQSGYFWDILKQKKVFSRFDIAHYSYGLIQMRNLLHGKNPLNNLIKISKDINAYIKNYTNVVFIGHSQGGLLAKLYSSLYYKEQGVYLVTLDTPHNNTGLFVMKIDKKEMSIWSDDAGYCVPHIFCASINDQAVKPIEAIETCYYGYYLAKETLNNIGHSHLSQNPDQGLINIMCNEMYQFYNSGVSKIIYNNTCNFYGNKSGRSKIKISYSRSLSKLNKIKSTKSSCLIENPWELLIDTNKATQNLFCQDQNLIHIKYNGTSINYLIKYILNYFTDKAYLSVDHIDFLDLESLEKSNTALCEDIFENHYYEDNPYKKIFFDPYDFKKKGLIENPDFLKYFINILDAEHFMIEKYYDAGLYKKELKKHYTDAVNNYRKILASKIYNECYSVKKANIGVERFCYLLCKAIKEIKLIKKNKHLYSDVYKVIIETFIEKTKYHNMNYFGIREIEIIISNTMKSDGEIYWLDKFIDALFCLDVDKAFI